MLLGAFSVHLLFGAAFAPPRLIGLHRVAVALGVTLGVVVSTSDQQLRSSRFQRRLADI